MVTISISIPIPFCINHLYSQNGLHGYEKNIISILLRCSNNFTQ